MMNSNHSGPRPFDLLGELAKFGIEHSIPLNDPEAIPKFAIFVGRALGGALSNPALLHGQRVEAMFEALLVSLGQFTLLKAEDNGKVHPIDRYIAPDFRVVLLDGTQWLIEVKNAYVKDAFDPERRFMTRRYREKLENYATATGGRLKLAVFWAAWGIWTLVSPEQFVDEQGNVSFDMGSGFLENELGTLGDRLIGTKPPIRLRLEANPGTISPIGPDGMVNFTIEEFRIFSGREELLDPTEKEIAWAFMLYGDWVESEPIPVLEEGVLTAVEFRWDPDKDRNDPFSTIGTFSQVFSRYYSEHTMENEKIVQLYAPPQPGWFAPLLADDYKSKALPLLRAKFQAKHLSAELLKGLG